jgi:hypothetical protein
MQYREIELTQDKWAIIDALDYSLVAPFTWQAQKDRNTWYATSARGGLPSLRMHRLISCPPDSMIVDHVDGNGLCNSRSNLRWTTRSQNALNTPLVVGSSGYRGVTRTRYGTWQVAIQANRKPLHIGTFSTAEEAARAYDAAAKLYHGKFALLNFE